ncbi:sulfotransferase domain-containing protein [Stappia sp. F7233]|uniref:Sulfotransferase domain-containing protein n=1 Tax=Stappia albiluteola TaxID=2758565 RepID=A0A839AHX6_9HYPH|nr:sulfotransferase domain-containing protein [Stappia albiluteola]MBA5778534.1 sulfotransferase domain-containing protein [Stappia albiluteola]
MIFDLFRAGILASVAKLSPLKRSHILLACMPKSGSSFLADAISRLPGMRQTSLSLSSRHREQELDLHILARKANRNYVAQQHIKYSEETGRLLSKFDIRPIVLTRNLFDIIPSIRDHVRNESSEMPMAWLDPACANYNDAELECLIADLVMPWYVNFYVSWQHCPNALWVTYDQVRTDPEGVLKEISEFSGINAGASIEQAVAAAKAERRRFNVGASGRGENISPEAREWVCRLFSHYRNIDFQRIGAK